MVQIHSPRPLLLEPTIYRHTIVAERLVGGQHLEASNPLVRRFFPRSDQCVTLHFQLGALVSFYGQHGQLLQFCLEFWKSWLSLAVCNIDFLVGWLTRSEFRCRKRDFIEGRLRSHLLERRHWPVTGTFSEYDSSRFPLHSRFLRLLFLGTQGRKN